MPGPRGCWPNSIPRIQTSPSGCVTSGFPELGSVRLTELACVRGRLGLPVERDLSFVPEKTRSAYAAEARLAGRITA